MSGEHEVWWIYSPERHEWGGLRVAHFIKGEGGDIVLITGETRNARIGPRVWDDISPREGWVKVEQISIPGPDKVCAAVDAALQGIAERITAEAFDK